MAAVRAAPATALLEVFRNSRRVVMLVPALIVAFTGLSYERRLRVHGPKHPTTNIEHPTSIDCPHRSSWVFDVGCWMLDVAIGDTYLLLLHLFRPGVLAVS